MTAAATATPQELTVRGEQVTTAAMTAQELAAHAEDVALLELPQDRTGLQPLRGWTVRDSHGEHIGRIFARSAVVTAEWFDRTEGDWILARWGCRRPPRAVAEILILRDQAVRAAGIAPTAA